MAKRMRIIIAGAGDVGQTLSNVLASKDHEVILIESDGERAKKVASSTDSLVLKGDATNMDIMKDAGIEKADVVVAVTNDDKTNLMVCQIAKSSNVNKIIVRVNDPKNDQLFTKLGIHFIVSAVNSQVTDIKKLLYQRGEERIIAVLGGGEFQIVEVPVAKEAYLTKIKVSEFKSGVIGMVYRNGKSIIPTEDTKVKGGDVLIIIVGSKKVDQLLKFTK